MGGDGVDPQHHGEVPPRGSTTNHGDDGETWGRQRVGVSLSSGGNVSRGDPTYWGVHQEVSGDHIGKGILSPHI